MLIRSGTVTALYLFDIADEIDLAAVPRLLEQLAREPIDPWAVVLP